jgi:hypothetical protein
MDVVDPIAQRLLDQRKSPLRDIGLPPSGLFNTANSHAY